jgi:protein RecA
MPAKKAAKKTAKKKAKGQEQAAAPVRRRGAPGMEEWDALEAEILAERGAGTVMTASKLPPADRIPFGAFTLDFALMGGIPEGANTMLYGIESSGKTTLALKGVAGFHKKYPQKIAVWVDTEMMFDKDWAARMGCDIDRIKLIQPQTGEEAVDLLAASMHPLPVGLVVLDSIPGCVPKTIVERSAEDQTMAVLARLMGLMCSKVLTAWGEERKRGHRVTLITINQFRSKVGLVFGDPRVLPGGRQINHLPTTKVEFMNKEVMGEDAAGNQVVDTNDHTFKITKVKHGSSIREGQFQMVINPDFDDWMSQGDFDDHKTVIQFAKKMGLLAGSGGKYGLPWLTEDTWATHDALGIWLKEWPHYYDRLRAGLIAMQRVTKGMTPLPPDRMLYGVDLHSENMLVDLLTYLTPAEV